MALSRDCIQLFSSGQGNEKHSRCWHSYATYLGLWWNVGHDQYTSKWNTDRRLWAQKYPISINRDRVNRKSDNIDIINKMQITSPSSQSAPLYPQLMNTNHRSSPKSHQSITVQPRSYIWPVVSFDSSTMKHKKRVWLISEGIRKQKWEQKARCQKRIYTWLPRSLQFFGSPCLIVERHSNKELTNMNKIQSGIQKLRVFVSLKLSSVVLLSIAWVVLIVRQNGLKYCCCNDNWIRSCYFFLACKSSTEGDISIIFACRP